MLFRSVVVISHFERPKGKRVPELSLAPIAKAMADILKVPVAFANDCIGPDAEGVVSKMKNGDIALLENLRYHAGEEENDQGFAKNLAKLGDFYVNDAFSVSHRAHASTHALANQLPSAAGRSMEAELSALANALGDPQRPVAAVVGGAKVSTKLDLLGNLIKKVDVLVIGGGMCFTFLAAQGFPVGDSICELDQIATCRRLLGGGKPIHLPDDIVGLDASGNFATFGQRLPEGAKGLDIGPGSAAAFSDVIMDARTVFWNEIGRAHV